MDIICWDLHDTCRSLLLEQFDDLFAEDHNGEEYHGTEGDERSDGAQIGSEHETAAGDGESHGH